MHPTIDQLYDKIEEIIIQIPSDQIGGLGHIKITDIIVTKCRETIRNRMGISMDNHLETVVRQFCTEIITQHYGLLPLFSLD